MTVVCCYEIMREYGGTNIIVYVVVAPVRSNKHIINHPSQQTWQQSWHECPPGSPHPPLPIQSPTDAHTSVFLQVPPLLLLLPAWCQIPQMQNPYGVMRMVCWVCCMVLHSVLGVWVCCCLTANTHVHIIDMDIDMYTYVHIQYPILPTPTPTHSPHIPRCPIKFPRQPTTLDMSKGTEQAKDILSSGFKRNITNHHLGAHSCRGCGGVCGGGVSLAPTAAELQHELVAIQHRPLRLYDIMVVAEKKGEGNRGEGKKGGKGEKGG